MKTKHMMIAIMAAVLVIMVSGLGFAQDVKKIGFLDLTKIFDNYEKTKDYDKTLEKEHETYQKELNTRVEAIQDKQGKLNLMKEDEKAKLEEEIATKMDEIRQWDQEKRTELMGKRDEKIRGILLEIEQVVSDYAKKNGFDLILNDRVLIYGEQTMDVTDAVLKTLNSNYKK